MGAVCDMELQHELLGYALARILEDGVNEVDKAALLEQSSYQLLCTIKEIILKNNKTIVIEDKILSDNDTITSA